MSNDSSGEKTEEPTPKKLRDLRKKGQVAKSKEVVSTSLIVCMFLYIGFDSSNIIDKFSFILAIPIDLMDLPFDLAFTLMIDRIFMSGVLLLAPFIFILFVVGILANILQVGVLFSTEPLKLDIKKIDPIQGAKKIFSQSNFVEFLKSVFKVLVVSIVVTYVIAKNINDLMYAPGCGVDCLLVVFGHTLEQMLVYVCVVFIVVAVLDLAYQKYEFIRKNRMTKDQVKRDHKESEGDPIIKNKRKKLQRELASGQQLEAVKKSTVVVKNPTHYAVAIRYDAKDAPLPIVMAKGENNVAKQIIKIAEQNNIPIMENVPLAQGLFADAAVGGFVPVDFIPAVVEVLHWVKENYGNYNQAR